MNKDSMIIENRNKDVSLIGIFGAEEIGNLQSRIARATGFSVSTIDYRGKKVVPGYFQEAYRTWISGNNNIHMNGITEALSAAKAAIVNRPYLFAEKNGLVKAAVPIIVNGQYLGALVCGYVFCENPDYIDPSTGEELILPEAGTDACKKDDRTEKALSGDIPAYPAEKIRDITELIFFLVQEMCRKEDYAMKLGDSEHNKVHLWDLRKKNRELKKTVQEMKLVSMKNNIQPQVLLNMLATLFNFAVLEDAVKTQEIADIFTSFLRYYVEFGRDYVSVGQEIQQIGRYLDVLKKQYQDRVDIVIERSQEDDTQLIPKLIIFPLVEYIVNFGVLNSNYRGIIRLDTEYTMDRCVVTIQFEHTSKYLKNVGYLNESGNVYDQRFYLEQLNLLEQRISYEYSEDYKLSVNPELIILDLPRNPGSIDNRVQE